MSDAYNGAQAIMLREQPLAYVLYVLQSKLVALCISTLPGIRDFLLMN